MKKLLLCYIVISGISICCASQEEVISDNKVQKRKREQKNEYTDNKELRIDKERKREEARKRAQKKLGIEEVPHIDSNKWILIYLIVIIKRILKVSFHDEIWVFHASYCYSTLNVTRIFSNWPWNSFEKTRTFV